MNRTFQIGRNKLMLLQNGTRFFPQLCADIDAAQHYVYLETYIFAADETGRLVSQALQRAALRDLTVTLLIDGFGSAELPQAWIDELREAGVDVQWFRREISPFTLKPNRLRRLRRLHRKLAVIDGEIAFIGGINILNDIPDGADFDAPRLDYAVRVQGKAAIEVQEAMRRLWDVVKSASLRKRIGRLQSRLIGGSKKVSGAFIELLLRDNLRHRRDIEHAYLQAIASAQREIVIANAYFLPGREFRQALKDANRRGVRVVLLLQGKVEYIMQHYATLALYGKLLEAGIEVYEYRDSFLHAKVGVIDSEWATVGSSNLEPFSFFLAREANLVVRDEAFSKSLRTSLFRAIESGGVRVDTVDLNPLSLILARLSYGLIRLALGLLGLSKKQ
ncbi:MAG: putative cardiolipin synthase [Gallionellaceae bacterium]|nr:MAG: putative cardiolipin synthase [Gallionellaceae bacterium]